ncbi:MAG: hypothetical protein IOD12_08635 [Silvanigrellales bacterium]|nr:hypothetical protein [Silvanigrellales bacterium]
MTFLRFCDGAEEIVGKLESNVQSGLFTAWSAASRTWQASAFFADEWCPRDNATPHPTFDLASLTKPLFVPLLLKLEGLSAEAWATPRESLRGRSLLECADHLTGAPAWCWMGRASWVFKADSRVSQGQHEAKSLEDTRARVSDFLTKDILERLDDSKRGQTLYSDLNAFLLARAYETLHANNPLAPRDLWVAGLKTLNDRLGAHFQHASLLPRSSGLFGTQTVPFAPYVSVEDEAGGTGEPAGFESFGPVHDTNANLLATRLGGVVSGHAGLLGSVADVDAALPHLAMGHDALVRELKAGEGRRFLLSLDTPSGADSTAGLRNFPSAVHGSILGHLGYTGTSFWFRQHEGVVSESHILLTNRVARRARFGGEVPRLLALTTRSGEWLGGGVAKPGGGWQSIPDDDFRALAREHARARRLLWDSSQPRFPPEFADVRREFGRLAWDL